MFRLGFDMLEDRVVPAVFQVTNALDPRGMIVPGSLRWAVTRANLGQNQGSQVEITSSVKGPIILRAGELPIKASMTIENDSGVPLTIRPGAPNSRIVHVFADSRTTGVTLSGQADDALDAVGRTGDQSEWGRDSCQQPTDHAESLLRQRGRELGRSDRLPRTGTHGNGGGIYSRAR